MLLLAAENVVAGALVETGGANGKLALSDYTVSASATMTTKLAYVV